MTDSLRNASVVPVLRVSAREASLVDEAAYPAALPEVDGAPQRQDDITAESAEPTADKESRRRFSRRIGSRRILVPLAFVATLFVGFGSMTVMLRVVDWPTAQSDTKPVPTTAAPVTPPSAAAPTVTTPLTSAPSGLAVENEPTPPAPAPAPAAEASESPAPPSSSSPSQNPAGKPPPGQNR